jgi:hypothetical protein
MGEVRRSSAHVLASPSDFWEIRIEARLETLARWKMKDAGQMAAKSY